MRYEIIDVRYKMNLYNKFVKIFFGFFILFFILSCQKELKLKYNKTTIKQVIIANFTSDNYLQVNISKSKQPDDFSPVEFLKDCKVDLYEDGIYKETMLFVLKDTLSGLGFYTSSFIIRQNKTYKIISTHEQLGVATTEEYLPPLNNAEITLLQHADALHPNITGKYLLSFQDSALIKNYYTITAFYEVLKPVVNRSGDTIYKIDFIFDSPSYTPEIPNTVDYYRSFCTDANFDGQFKTFVFDFPSQYNDIFKEIYFLVEFSNVGPGYYNWYVQQLPNGTTNFNDGQNERINFSSNITNGYGHFSAYNAIYKRIRIK